MAASSLPAELKSPESRTCPGQYNHEIGAKHLQSYLVAVLLGTLQRYQGCHVSLVATGDLGFCRHLWVESVGRSFDET